MEAPPLTRNEVLKNKLLDENIEDNQGYDWDDTFEGDSLVGDDTDGFGYEFDPSDFLSKTDDDTDGPSASVYRPAGSSRSRSPISRRSKRGEYRNENDDRETGLDTINYSGDQNLGSDDETETESESTVSDAETVLYVDEPIDVDAFAARPIDVDAYMDVTDGARSSIVDDGDITDYDDVQITGVGPASASHRYHMENTLMNQIPKGTSLNTAGLRLFVEPGMTAEMEENIPNYAYDYDQSILVRAKKRINPD